MKKLIIAAAVVCAAVVSQAAAISWTTTLKTADAEEKGKFTSTDCKTASASLYIIDKTQYNTWLGELTAATTFDAQQTAMLGIVNTFDGVKPDKTATLYKGSYTLADPTDISGASGTNPVDLYAAVVYTYNDGTTDWYIANVGHYEAKANANASVPNMGAIIGGGSSGTAIQGWATAAVPEPTSGLLLLLGVAGLALRRRRA